ncbi:hypothetical protein [Limosilactobacillus reuteri]|uniref:hypothetical protein n=1 Tax=Limosilactobacillus reuteri TaxID=1598 RepID=UPI00298C864F|nr:hypothetical protein [Limosilactobacillus reuteri]
MFGNEILNGRQLCNQLGISTTILYSLIDNGLPYHQLTANSRKYYILNEVENWLLESGFHQETRWTK